MKKLFLSIIQKLNNLPLQKKILFLIFSILALTTAGSILGFQMIFSSGNRMLYESLAGSLSYSAQNISENLETIESMTGMLLADEKAQKQLSVVADSTNDSAREKAYRTLSYLVPDYYQNFKQYGIRYINLYNKNYITYSDLSKSKNTPDEVHQEIIENAHTYSGAPIWTTSYGNRYGLFLSRDVRRAERLSLDTLGTILVSIDLEKIISSSTRHLYLADTAEYVLFKDEQEIYHSPFLNDIDTSGLLTTNGSTYGITRLNRTPYFYVKGSIPKYGWNYICLSSYKTIQNAQRSYICVSALIILLVILVSIVFSKKIIYSITVHFSSLIEKMDAFGKDESVLPVSNYNYMQRTDEIGELHRRFDHMARKVQVLIQQKYAAELLSKEAQLKALESQINPHFLYNTLESLNWNAKAIGATEISTMVEALGSLLRTTLSHKETISTIEHELKIVSDYMTIIKIRFDDRINYENQIPPNLNTLILPQLTLQPLVENAVNYALEEMTDVCTIQLTGSISHNRIQLCIINSGSQFPPNLLRGLAENTIQPHGFGIGLLNIQKRLQLCFGADYGLNVYNKDDDHAVVQIDIPYFQEEQYHDKTFNRR